MVEQKHRKFVEPWHGINLFFMQKLQFIIHIKAFLISFYKQRHFSILIDQ